MIAGREVFVTGGTGYIGRPLIRQLLARGHRVRALTRRQSATRLPDGCVPVIGNALDASTFADELAPADTVVHLVGTPHPSPRQAAKFEAVDLASIRATVAAVTRAGCVRHLVYVSVAQPAPVMKAYQAARAAGEDAIRSSNVPATVLRPWYVLGRDRRWPYLLLPLYWLAELVPSLRDGARRLGLVTHAQMVRALVAAVEHPPAQTRTVSVAEIRRAGA